MKNMKEIEICAPDVFEEEIYRLLSLTEDEYYNELLSALGLRECVLLIKKKYIKSKTLYKRELKLVRI